jgi:hypothetical protein
MRRGYEFEKGHFVVFEPDELKTLEESPSHIVDILAFVPDKAIDPIFCEKAAGGQSCDRSNFSGAGANHSGAAPFLSAATWRFASSSSALIFAFAPGSWSRSLSAMSAVISIALDMSP